MSEFGGLSIALSSLQTQQRALEIAANNVANASTAGYTRQAANMTTLGGSLTPAFFATSLGLTALAKYTQAPSSILQHVPAPAPDATHPTPASAAEGSILEALRSVITSPSFTLRRAQ